MKTKYVMGIDYGTNGVRVGIFDLQGQQLSFATENLTTMIPHNGWAEQSPAEWWQALGKQRNEPATWHILLPRISWE